MLTTNSALDFLIICSNIGMELIHSDINSFLLTMMTNNLRLQKMGANQGIYFTYKTLTIYKEYNMGS